MNDFVKYCLGDTKFICGDEPTVADFAIGGHYVNVVENENNPHKALWQEGMAQAPDRLKQYIADFKEEMAEYLANRPSGYSM